MKAEDFINIVANKIQKENQKRNNILFNSVIIAQSALETGWGSSNLMMKANAIFGIKATSSWKGKVFNSKTNEVYDGRIYNITACFRAYESIEESISDYFDLITKSERYRKACVTSSPLECITEIKNGGYATDPKYIEKVMSIINDYNLERFDKEIQNDFVPYIVGKNYTLQENMFVRTGPSTLYNIKAFQELTEDGKKHALVQKVNENAILKKGTVVTCLDVFSSYDKITKRQDFWLKIPSGYVAGFHKGVRYIK